MCMEQIGKKKCLEFGVFRPRLTSNPIQNANALQRLKNAFLHFSMLLPYSSFFSLETYAIGSLFSLSTNTLLI